MILTAILCGTVSQLRAQTCPAPAFVQATSTPAACFGAGTVTVTQVNGVTAPSDSSVRYQLVYDSATQTVVKNWQASPVFTEVQTGLYIVNVQTICEINGPSATTQSSPVQVSGTASAVNATATVISKYTPGCTGGSLYVTATGGSGNYSYALVSSLNAADDGNYVSPRQSSDTFSNLQEGTYYVRAYDNCGNYATSSTNINTVNNVAEVTAFPWFNAYYGCDSFYSPMTVYNYNNESASSNWANERLWYTIGINGVTNTITDWSWYGDRINYEMKFHLTTYPDTIYWYYQTSCGTILSASSIANAPKIRADITLSSSGGATCAGGASSYTYIISVKDSVSSNPIYNTSVSTDGGNSWTDLGYDNSYTATLQPGQTYSVWVADDCDTAAYPLTPPITIAAPLTMTVMEDNMAACPGNSGIVFTFPDSIVSIIATNPVIAVVQQPAGANLPDSFALAAQGSCVITSYTSYLAQDMHTATLWNLPLGTYEFSYTDSCGRTVDTTIVLTHPVQRTFGITTISSPSCNDNNYTLTFDMTNNNYWANGSSVGDNGNGGSVLGDYCTQIYPYNSMSLSLTNTVTGVIYGAYGIPLYSGTYPGFNLPVGIYTAKEYYTDYFGNPSACTSAWDSTIVITSGGVLSAPTIITTSACGDGTTSTAVISVTGGSGPGTYTYQLRSLQSVSGGDTTWVNVGATQSTGIFSGLANSTLYNIKVMDNCGYSVNQNVSFNSTPLYLTFSTTAQPCAGDDFTMLLPTIDGVTSYSWTANGATISGATGNSYTVTVPDSGAVTYVGQITVGSCLILSQPYTLDPGNCGNPLTLPITGFQLNAQVQANNAVQLNWETKMEINSKNFTVQRSADGGKTWTDVGTVATKAVNGNSSTPLSYTLTDANVQPGSYEYQVVETDINGNTAKSNVVAVQITAGAKVYPIPASTYVRIVLPASVSNAAYRMISTDGKVVLQGSMSNQGNFGQISVAGLASAVYFLQVTINNAVQTYKVQVQH